MTQQFYKLLEPLVTHNVSLIFLSFPRLVEDPDYFYEQLKPIFVRHGVGHDEVLKVHGQIADTNLVTSVPGAHRRAVQAGGSDSTTRAVKQ